MTGIICSLSAENKRTIDIVVSEWILSDIYQSCVSCCSLITCFPAEESLLTYSWQVHTASSYNAMQPVWYLASLIDYNEHQQPCWLHVAETSTTEDALNDVLTASWTKRRSVTALPVTYTGLRRSAARQPGRRRGRLYRFFHLTACGLRSVHFTMHAVLYIDVYANYSGWILYRSSTLTLWGPLLPYGYSYKA